MICEDMTSYAANKALRKLGIKPGQRIATVELEEDEGCTFVEYEGKLNLVAGQTYEVQTDSGTYRAVCKELDEGEGAYFRYLGNADIFDDVSAPGDHYCIGEGRLRENFYIAATDRNFGKNISLSTPGTHIDPKYFPEGGVGYTNPGMVLTWDGDTSNANEAGLVKIHNKYVDLSNVGSLTLVSDVLPGMGSVTVTDEFSAMYDPDFGGQLLLATKDILGVNNTGYPMLVAIPTEVTGEAAVAGLTEGVYIPVGTPIRIAEIHFAETIHPIDPKYLPEGFGGGGLPVVKLTTEPGINGYATLTTDECSALNAAFEKKMPVVCHFGLMGMTVSIPLMYIVNPADSSGYLGTSPFGDLHLTVGNVGNWTAMYRPKG